MKIISTKNYDAMSRATANIISAQIILKPDCVLGLATGSSPIGTYNQLIKWFDKGDLDFSQVRTVNLDEYVGLGRGNRQSYAYFMNTNLLDHVNINPKNANIPNGLDRNAARECARYDQVIHELGGIDLQLLGLGVNGHIGFNEPDEVFSKGTHLVQLSESTRKANQRFFDNLDEVPTCAYTMGIFDIIQARRVVMVASGVEKAKAIKEAFFGPITPKMPASILQFHKDFTLVADEAALSLL